MDALVRVRLRRATAGPLAVVWRVVPRRLLHGLDEDQLADLALAWRGGPTLLVPLRRADLARLPFSRWCPDPGDRDVAFGLGVRTHVQWRGSSVHLERDGAVFERGATVVRRRGRWALLGLTDGDERLLVAARGLPEAPGGPTSG